MSTPSNFAELSWSDDGQPFSTHFEDVYFSRESGLAETRHVFLHHNQLAERWSELAPDTRFCIGETGFGTGLNFLCAWQLWDQLAPAGARLHFVSCEKFPLSSTDLQRALALWPELQPWACQLLARYTDLAAGWQHFSLAEGRVTLTLLIGDVLDTLPQQDGQIDAWFLDGFAPAKNPDMWQPALYAQLARLSAPGATLATFTSVGEVRRGLQAAGFSMQKVKGYGRKREMLCGQLDAAPAADWTAPWYQRPAANHNERNALIIGAGLAGCATALSLARRGWQVTLIERHAHAAAEASGNTQGILYCKLSPHQTPLSRFVQASYAYGLRLLREVLPQGEGSWSACGVLQLCTDDKERQRQLALAAQGYPEGFLQAVDTEQASFLAGVQVDRPGLFFPGAGWVNPPSLCQAMLQHENIRLLTHCEALQLEQRGEHWHALDAQQQSLASAEVAIICCANDSLNFSQTSNLPLKPIRGQVTQLPATPDSEQLRTVLCAEGYISPARQGEHHVGASFRFDRLDNQPSSEENLSNLQLLDKLSPQLAEALDPQDPASLPARAALRCTSSDYLPLIGPVADAQAFRSDYAVLRKDASKQPTTPTRWHSGLYINTAHGSRGMVSCPLSGELIAAWLDNEPLPLPQDLVAAVHPNRFMLRQLIRGQ
ncbi:MAG: bifunctional tRNA (5-methylaminomethyl-2-thiouridine)(34)-methyltransferase MnmD/FAD-dependent 5-carboxymethylaminomethyl-2-thiouridine(34) oxidoreductase MnmC [Pseudomonas sp.]